MSARHWTTLVHVLCASLHAAVPIIHNSCTTAQHPSQWCSNILHCDDHRVRARDSSGGSGACMCRTRLETCDSQPGVVCAAIWASPHMLKSSWACGWLGLTTHRHRPPHMHFTLQSDSPVLAEWLFNDGTNQMSWAQACTIIQTQPRNHGMLMWCQ